jgi:hypothetical protein
MNVRNVDYRDLMVADLASGEAAWEARAIDAARDADAYRTLALAALERLHAVTQQLACERKMRLELADELRRYTAAQVGRRAA